MRRGTSVCQWYSCGAFFVLSYMTYAYICMRADSYPVAIYLSVFWGERRLGIRLRRLRGLLGREEGKIALRKANISL